MSRYKVRWQRPDESWCLEDHIHDDLGLAIERAAYIAKRLENRVHVVSVPDGGLVMTLNLSDDQAPADELPIRRLEGSVIALIDALKRMREAHDSMAARLEDKDNALTMALDRIKELEGSGPLRIVGERRGDGFPMIGHEILIPVTYYNDLIERGNR